MELSGKLRQNLDNPFSVQGQMYLGTIAGGADGIVFVMQNNCLNAGAAGGGIGYGGMTGQSIAVEFDTHQNPEYTDPVYDHIAIERNGNVDHANGANTLAAPVQMHAVKADVEDGLWYDFQINYNPATSTLQVYFNGSLRVSLVYNIKANIFGGNPYVYWGFTSATGGSFNDQQVRLSATTTYQISDETICTESVQKHLPPLAGPNIALGKPAVASSNNGGNTASSATDGNGTYTGGTRWESQHGVDPQWIYVDLVNPSDIDSVVLYWETANARSYKIQTSTDGVTWTDQFTELAGPAGAHMRKIVFTATNVRYVRMHGTQRNTGYGYSLYEFRVLGTQKYLWSPNDGSIDDIYSTNPIFSPTVTTTYTVNLIDPCAGIVPFSFTITVNCPAPVELTEFHGAVVNDYVHLNWSTAWESNSDYFEIQRSFDGIHFSNITSVDAAGNSTINSTYTYNDYESFSGLAYYRLNGVDVDGSTQMSPVISVLKNSSIKPAVEQAIFEEETKLLLPGNPDYVKCTIVNIMGNEINSWENQSPSDSEYIGRTLMPGSYMLIIESNLYTKSIKINKLW